MKTPLRFSKIFFLVLTAFCSTQNIFSQTITPPYFDDFENGNNGWTVLTTSGSNWELGLPAYQNDTTHSGVNAWSVDLDSSYERPSHTELYSPVFDFTNIVGARLSFWFTCNLGYMNDGVRIDYSINNGASWQVLGIHNDPNGLQWYNSSSVSSSNGIPVWSYLSMYSFAHAEHKLDSLNNQANVQFRFVFDADNIPTFYPVSGFIIDDFSIDFLPSVDAAVKTLQNPLVNSPAGISIPVKFKIQNLGAMPLTSATIGYSINGGAPTTQTWSGNLATYDDSLINLYSFSVPLGNYSVCAFINVPDTISQNDTLCMTSNGIVPVTTIYISSNTSCFNFVSVPFNVSLGTSPVYSDSFVCIINFGDGFDSVFTTNYGSNFGYLVKHHYSYPGIYSVRFKATDHFGNTTITDKINGINLKDCKNVKGTTFIDLDQNCIFTSAESFLARMPVMITRNGDLVDMVYSNDSGSFAATFYNAYSHRLHFGNMSSNGVSSFCPPYISLATNYISGQDLGIDALAGFDLSAKMNTAGIKPNSDFVTVLDAKNNFFNPKNGQVILSFDTSEVNFISAFPVPDLLAPGTATWNLIDLMNYKNNFQSVITLHAKPSVLIGYSICLSASIAPVAGDLVPVNNIFNLCSIVSNTTHSNFKTVEPLGLAPGGRIPAYQNLTYTIYFQNTDSGFAKNAFVIDTLDSNLDLTTLEIVASYPPVKINVLPGNILKFSFDNILLPDTMTNEAQSHGFIYFSVKPKNNLADGTVITNRAFIVVGFSAMVVTGTTVNTIDFSLGVPNISDAENTFQIFPNPASKEFKIKNDLENIGIRIQSIAMADMLGQKIYGEQYKNSGREIVIDVSKFPEGIYFVHVSDQKNSLVRKILVMH